MTKLNVEVFCLYFRASIWEHYGKQYFKSRDQIKWLKCFRRHTTHNSAECLFRSKTKRTIWVAIFQYCLQKRKSNISRDVTKGRVRLTDLMNFRKSSERGGGHFQSKNLYCKIWTFKQGFFSMKVIQKGLLGYVFTLLPC